MKKMIALALALGLIMTTSVIIPCFASEPIEIE